MLPWPTPLTSINPPISIPNILFLDDNRLTGKNSHINKPLINLIHLNTQSLYFVSEILIQIIKLSTE